VSILSEDKIIQQLAELIENLGFDYDRMSQSGQQTYEEICSLMNKLIGG
jgi:hypothetical protein